jgi:uncharacterized protein (DUF362 family)
MRDQQTPARPSCGRRRFLGAASSLVALGTSVNLVRSQTRAFSRADVFIARARSYSDDLAGIIRRGLAELGLSRDWAWGKTVLLKPNLVEPDRGAPHVGTHPELVRAVAAVFRDWRLGGLFVAEGPGHCRDSDLVLDVSGLGRVLDQERIEFVDLNVDDVMVVRNRLGFSRLRSLYLPRSLRRADLVVSLPKLKTHHWVGLTCAMKNLFGMMPGTCYGWPKNVFHKEGIAESIVDINGAVAPHLAIVDGIVAMEGDGPIMGTPRAAGVLILGTNLPAVDATAARLMEIDPCRIPYLAAAAGRLGPIQESQIRQRGEAIASLAQRFELVVHPGLAGLRSDRL